MKLATQPGPNSESGLDRPQRMNIADVRTAIERGDIANDVMARWIALAATQFIADDDIGERLRDELIEAIDDPPAAFKILDRIEAANTKTSKP
ncbi:hypothetical protein [Mesorhizobium sp. CN2-181]|uniref:hypothetical protein n=1 Tax=Mesorhizobium yinganensis TaxID=3157707 RepID=UPI0032B86761